MSTSRSISILIRALGAVLILYGAFIVAVPVVLPHLIVRSPNYGIDVDTSKDPGEELLFVGRHRHLRIPVGEPNVSLSCYVIEPASVPFGTILILHGHRDNKLSELDVARALAEEDYRCVLVDHRGHGLSTGDFVSYGIFESRDMTVLLDSLQSLELLKPPVGVIGFSYGGAVGIQLAARDQRVEAIVAVSTFTSMREVVRDYVRCFLPIATPLISDAEIDDAVRRAGEIGDYDPADADTERAARSLRVPLLLFHGEEDWRIPVRHGERLSAAVRSECTFVRVPGCGHGDVLSAETQSRIVRESLEWFAQHMKRRISG